MLLTINEVAERLRITVPTVYKLIGEGKLKAFKIGNRFRVDEADLKAYQEQAIETLRAD